jgi:hypothetical protein
VPARKLRAVTPHEKPAGEAVGGGRPRKRATIANCWWRCGSGSRTTVSNPDCPPRDLAALTRRLQDIAKEIESLDLKAKQEAGEDGPSADEVWNSEAF